MLDKYNLVLELLKDYVDKNDCLVDAVAKGTPYFICISKNDTWYEVFDNVEGIYITAEITDSNLNEVCLTKKSMERHNTRVSVFSWKYYIIEDTSLFNECKKILMKEIVKESLL